MQWILGVGIIPVRFFHGDAAEIPRRYAIASDAEKLIRQGVLDLDQRIRDGELLRFATDTTPKGIPLSVELVHYQEHSGEVLNRFTIPEAEAAGNIETFPQVQRKSGVTPPKPSARPRTGRVKDENAD